MFDWGWETEEIFRERDDLGRRSGRSGSDLRTSSVELIKDRLVRGLAETTILPRLRIVLVSRAESFRSIIEGIPKGLVVTGEFMISCHEDLHEISAQVLSSFQKPTDSFEGSRASSRMGSHKDGFLRHLWVGCERGASNPGILLQTGAQTTPRKGS